MSIARRKKREAERHISVLYNLLSQFYEFMSQKEQPSDLDVRLRFKEDDQKWKNYCQKHNLPEQVSNEFNKQVSATWEQKKNQKKQ